ncbi:MAG: Bax inhibitor-1 family protein [Gemmataceae bacterium]|nr:Bax inhibitor-1 family protein [Gemmataceae bacterium]
MAYSTDGYITDRPASQALPAERTAFIQKTYLHLAGAIGAFAGLEYLLIQTGMGETLVKAIFGSGGMLGMLALMGAFIGAGYLAQWWANNSASKPMQYAGLGLYVVMEAVIFLPLLYVAMIKTGDTSLIAKAGFLTLALVAGLTTAVFMTKADFSFMGTALCVLGWVAFGTILVAYFMGTGLGLWFTVLMIALASGYLVYDTSNVLHHYPTTHYVAASLALFSSVALLFYYILRFAIQTQSRD